MKTISSGYFTDICYHAGHVYVTRYNDPAIYVYDQNTWNRIRTLDACKSGGNHFNHKLGVTSRGITLACYNDHCINVLGHGGKLQQKHVLGEFKGPHLCSVESDGSMLVADHGNHRCLVFHAGKWGVLPLNPRPPWPWDAVVTQNALYVVSFEERKLIKYKIN